MKHLIVWEIDGQLFSKTFNNSVDFQKHYLGLKKNKDISSIQTTEIKG